MSAKALIERIVLRKGWIFVGVFGDPPPAPPGYTLETSEDGFLGIVTHYRHVARPRPDNLERARRFEALAFAALCFIAAPPVVAAVMIGFF